MKSHKCHQSIEPKMITSKFLSAPSSMNEVGFRLMLTHLDPEEKYKESNLDDLFETWDERVRVLETDCDGFKIQVEAIKEMKLEPDRYEAAVEVQRFIEERCEPIARLGWELGEDYGKLPEKVRLLGVYERLAALTGDLREFLMTPSPESRNMEKSPKSPGSPTEGDRRLMFGNLDDF